MLPLPDAAALLDALHFASAKHRDQRRQDSCGSPFVTHTIETAWLLARVGGVRDRTMLLSAVLHDILEDTTATPADLERLFGVAVRRLVEELTDERGLSTGDRRRRQVARVARASCEAKQIRLADKIANLRSLPVQWSRTECEEYVDFAEQVAAAVRGANVPLDRLFVQMAQRTRMAIRAGGRNGSAPPGMPAMPPGHGNKGDHVDPPLRRLQRWLSKAEELVDTIVMESGGGDRRGPPFDPPNVTTSPEEHVRPPRPWRFVDPALRVLAEPGVGSVEFRKLDARSVMVSIDGAKEFRAPAGLARLLGVGILIIAERAEIFGDGGVEIGQIVRVEDNALTVDLGIAHPERVEEPELLA